MFVAVGSGGTIVASRDGAVWALRTGARSDRTLQGAAFGQGKIVAVGPTGATAVPANAEKIDARGKVIMPGLVDSHSHIGSPEGGDASGPIQPDVRVLDSIGGPAPLLERLERCGLTTLREPPEFYGLGLTIGNAEINLLELANAYAGLARLGNWRPLQLTARDGAFAPIATRDFTPPTPSPRTWSAARSRGASAKCGS